MFRFAHPEYLYGLYAIPLIVVFFWYVAKRRKKQLQKFADSKLQSVILPDYSRLKYWLKSSIFTLAIMFLIIAAANPQIGTRIENVKQKGIDVYICLDVSLSMTAQDIKPSRLEKAKYEISNLINKLHGDRIGLIVFAGEAYVQFPITTDYSAANLFLSAVSTNSVPEQGTAIASAINLAVKSFNQKENTEKAIVIITDGEDHQGDIMQAVKNATDKGIKIYAIGLGSTDGVPIPMYDKNGNQIGYKKDQNGNVVLTKLDPAILQQIASAGNGKYFQGSNDEDQLDKIYQDLSSLKKSEFGVKKVTDYADRFYYFLMAALILLIAEFFITERKSPLFARLNEKLGIQ
jgi:Ca-activated chloride channel homolog